MAKISLLGVGSGEAVEQAEGLPVNITVPSIVKIGVAPSDIQSCKQSGHDLVIALKSGETIVLKNFFVILAGGPPNELVLEENGKFWQASYVKDTSVFTFDEISTADNEVLKDETDDHTYLWLVGALGLAGVVALVKSGDGGGGHSHGPSTAGATALAAPVLKFDAQSGTLTVEGRPGAVVEIKGQNGQPVATQVIGSDGLAQIQIPAAASNQSITATQKLDGVESAPSPALALPLSKPSAGSIDLDKGELLVTGKPGSTVQLQDKDGKPVGEAVILDENGQGIIKLPQEVGGESVGIVAKDDGKESPAATVEVPLLKPVPGVIDAEKGELPVTGKPGSTVQLQDKDGKPVGEAVILDENGQGVIKLPQDVGGESVGIVAKDDGKESPAATVVVPPMQPTLGEVDPQTGKVEVTGKPGATAQLKDSTGQPLGEPVMLNEQGKGEFPLDTTASGQSVSAVQVVNGTESRPSTAVEVPLLKPTLGIVNRDKGELPVTGKPGATAQLQDKNGQPVGEPALLDDKGQGVIKLPQSTGGEVVGVVVQSAGKQSAAATIDIPLLKPILGVVDSEHGELPVSAKPGAAVQLQDSNGKPVGEVVVLDQTGQGIIPLPQTVGGETMGVVAKVDDQQSPVAAIDLPLLAPVFGAVDPKNNILEVSGKAGATLQLKDLQGKAIGAPVVLDEQGETVIELDPRLSDKNIAMTQSAKGLESVPTALTIPLLTPTLGEVDQQTRKVVVAGKPSGNFEIVDEETGLLYRSGPFDASGASTIKLPGHASGQRIVATQSAPAIASSRSKRSLSDDEPTERAGKLPDTRVSEYSSAVEVPLFGPDLSINDAGDALNLVGMPGATAEVSDSRGVIVGRILLDSDGLGTLPLSQDMGGERLKALVRDGGRESPDEFIDTPLLQPVLGAVDADKGELPVTGKPGATVQLQDSTGKAVGSPVTLDSQGKGHIEVPSTASGQLVSAVQKANGLDSPASTAVEVPLLKPALGVVDADKGELPVTGKPGSTVQLQDKDGKPVGEAVVLDDKGQGVIKLPQDVGGESVGLVAKDDGKESPAATVDVPLLKPLPGVVDVEKGELPVTGKPGSTVQLQDKDGKPVGEAVILDDKGQGVIKLPQEVGGESVGIVAKDDGKESPVATVDVPLLKPLPGVVDVEKGELPVTGKPGSTVQLQDKDGKPVGEAVVLDDKGQGVIKLPQEVGGESVGIVAKDDGQQSPAATVDVPLLKPQPGVVDAEKGELPVTGKPGSTVQLQDKDGKPVGEAVVLDDKGQGVIKLPQGVGGESVGIVAKDDGQQSPVATVTVPPLKPTLSEVDPQTGKVEVTGKPGATVQLQDKGGKPVGTPVTLDGQGKGEIQIPTTVSGQAVSAVQKVDGVDSLPSAAVTVPLLKPVLGVVDADNGELPVTGKPGATVQLQDKDGKPVGTPVTLDDKGQGVIKPPQGVGGESVGVVAKADGQQSPVATVAVPPLKPILSAVDPQTGKVEVTGKPGATVQLKDSTGKSVGAPVTLDGQGKGEIQIPTTASGQAVSAVQTVGGVDSVPSAAVTVPLLKPVLGAVDADKGALPVTGKPGSTVQLQDKDGKPVGTPVTLDDKGQGVIKLPQGVGGESVGVVAKADGQQSPVATVAVPPLKPTLSAADPQTGKVEVTGKPGAIVQLRDKDGKPVGTPVTLDAKGKGEIQIPTTASGQAVSAVQTIGGADSLPSAAVTVPLLKPVLGAVDADKGELPVTGKPGATVQLQDKDGKPVGTPVTLDNKGQGVIKLPQGVGGESVGVVAKADGQQSPVATVAVPPLKPILSEVDPQTGKVKVTGKPGATVQLQDKDGKPVGTPVTLDGQGKGEIQIPTTASGQAVFAVQKVDGVDSLPSAAVTVPLLKPVPGVVDADKGELPVTGKPGATVQLQDKDGKPVGTPVILDEKGQGVIKLPQGVGGESVGVVAKADGQQSPAATVDVPLLKPLLGVLNTEKGELPVTGKPGATVQLQDKDGKPVGEAVVLDEKGQGVIKLPQGVSGESASVVAKDNGQQSPAATVAVPPLKPTLSAVDQQTGKVEVTGKPGATVQLQDSTGKPVGSPVTLDGQGKGEIQIPTTVSGQAVSAVQKVDGVDSLPSAAVTVPLLKPVLGAVDADKGELPVTGKPGSNVQLQDKDGKPVGTPVTLDDKGQGVIKLPQGVGGESVGVVANADGQQSPVATVTVPPLKPTLSEVDPQTGKVEVTGKPGATVQLQ
ncbi:BapA prefix-like domain-containing protein, partial [Pseudomonas lactis]|uniref:BapA/Bap/LapF family prefix-like domain-containing protein n=3 Tax=Pseudomonas TaxID=286 RepID=UPI001F8BAF64|nr:BapA prefix-like domain-containing protein [Pseudomonas lactis]